MHTSKCLPYQAWNGLDSANIVPIHSSSSMLAFVDTVHMYVCLHARTHTHTHARARTHTHTHTHRLSLNFYSFYRNLEDSGKTTQ